MKNHKIFVNYYHARSLLLRVASVSRGLLSDVNKEIFLGAFAIMRNESTIIREWLEVHRREGVEHFFIIDHCSTDNWRERIADYMQAGIVSIIEAQGSNPDEIRSANSAWALDACEWLLIIDLDEFTYSRNEDTIATFLKTVPRSVAQVKIPWLIYRTSGNVSQPSSVVRGCTRQEDVVASQGWQKWHVKSIVRTSRHLHTRIHGHLVLGKSVVLKWTPCPGQFFPEFKLCWPPRSQRFGAAPVPVRTCRSDPRSSLPRLPLSGRPPPA